MIIFIGINVKSVYTKIYICIPIVSIRYHLKAKNSNKTCDNINYIMLIVLFTYSY